MNSPRSKSVKSIKEKNIWSEIKKNWTAYLFISPFYILFLVFGLFPILFSVVLSFQKWNGISTAEFVGLQQYRLLFADKDFWCSIMNTFIIWFESTIPMIVLALILAFLLNVKGFKSTHFYRSMFFLPNVTSIVAVAIVFSTLFGNKYGLINYLLSSMGMTTYQWLKVPWLLQIVLAIMVIWRWTGYNAIIFLAGLQKIDESLYEAARIDGANMFQIFYKITLPLLNPVIMFVVITSTIGGLQLFSEPQVMVGNSGGAGGGGMTIVLYLYKQGFVNNSFGYAASVSWILFFVIGIFSLINFLVVKATENHSNHSIKDRRVK